MQREVLLEERKQFRVLHVVLKVRDSPNSAPRSSHGESCNEYPSSGPNLHRYGERRHKGSESAIDPMCSEWLLYE